MAGKPKPSDERRSVRVPVQLTELEHASIREAADAVGISYSELLRSAGLSRAADIRRTAVNVRQLTLPGATAPKVARRRGRTATS
jgi:hypothetical protein